jgi:cytochrome c-type biogenesis protein CcmH
MSPAAERVRRPVAFRMALPALVVVVALVIGSGMFSSRPQTDAQRASAIAALVRCPSCTDVSVAQSNESTALAVRHQISRQVAEGRSTAQIEQTLVSQYGPTILLEPPDTGGFALIFIIPIVAGVGASGAVGVLFWRRSRQFESLRSAPAPAPAPEEID